MPKYTIEISLIHDTKLQIVIDAYNSSQNTSLDVEEWIVLHLKDVATAVELNAAAPGIKEQVGKNVQRALDKALDKKRQELIAKL